VRLYRPNVGVRQLQNVLPVRVLLIGIGGRHFVIPRVGVMAPSNLMLPPKQKAITRCPVTNVCYSYTIVYNRPRFHHLDMRPSSSVADYSVV
jgi:hypothetical protein